MVTDIYVNQKACKRGHYDRYFSNGMCVGCVRFHAKLNKDPDLKVEYQQLIEKRKHCTTQIAEVKPGQLACAQLKDATIQLETHSAFAGSPVLTTIRGLHDRLLLALIDEHDLLKAQLEPLKVAIDEIEEPEEAPAIDSWEPSLDPFAHEHF